jgi:precorrin-2 dehydrogenase/sirohydrochlorin ferrochelatase
VPENNTKDISAREIEYTFISLISHKTNVLIVGGGKAGYIKAKAFANRGCNVTIVSKDFIEEVKSIDKVVFIKGEYDVNYILDKHLVVIATDNIKLNEKIKGDCERHCKLYLYASNFKEGIFVTPVQRSTEQIEFAINTKGGSPKTSLFLSDIIKREMIKYDDFVRYTCLLRESIKDKKYKNEIMNFVNSKDFYFSYSAGKGETVLKMFYGDDMFEVENSYEKE